MSISTRPSSQQKDEDARKANTYCIAALISLSLALFVLSGGLFLVNPVSIIGYILTGLGVICMLLCILFFVLYSYHLRRAEKEQG